MSTFSQLQHQFQSFLLDENNAFADEVIGTKKVSKEVRLDIYKNAYQLRLQEALGESYSVLHGYVGDEIFDELCIEYINAFPSPYRSIRWYGDQMFSFLKSHKKYKKMPYLSELALLEWKSALVFDAENAPVLSLNDMALLSPDLWPTVTFKVHSTVQRMTLYWNVVPLWQAMSDEKDPPVLIKSAKPTTWIFWRKELVTQFISMPKDEACAFDAIVSGRTFSEMCEILCEFVSENEAGNRAAALLKGWIISGFIESIN